MADIYTLSRAMFESTVSMGLLAKSLIPSDLDRYIGYLFLETYKTYSHLQRLGLANISSVAPMDVPYLKSKRDEYVAKYGARLSSWTGQSLEQDVRLLDNSYPLTCNEEHFYEYLYCQVYRRGSPSTHSSFSGLSKGVKIEEVTFDDSSTGHRFTVNEPHLIFSCFHSLLVFLGSVRFVGQVLNKADTESYFQKMANYIISE